MRPAAATAAAGLSTIAVTLALLWAGAAAAGAAPADLDPAFGDSGISVVDRLVGGGGLDALLGGAGRNVRAQ